MPNIKFTPDKARALRKAYDDAIAKGMTGKDIITFEGQEIVLEYCKYVLEYLEEKYYIANHKLN